MKNFSNDKISKQDLEKNLATFSLIDPLGAVRVNGASTAHLKWTRTQVLENNLQGDFFYHDPRGALEEAKSTLDALDLKQCQILYIFGVGLGYFYEAAKHWLKENSRHSVVFIEDDPAVVQCFFSCTHTQEILKDPQVKLHLLDNNDLESEYPLFRELTWMNLLKPMQVTGLRSYLKNRPDLYYLVKERLNQESANKNDLVSEYLNCSVPFYKNYFPNLFQLPHSLLGAHLFGKFPAIPAIICGAGPSIAKHLKDLPSLKEHALIFAGGSGIKALSDAGIQPHFAGGIDPNLEQLRLYQKINRLDFPFFYHPRVHAEALKCVTGPKLYLSGTGGYSIGKWMDEQLGIPTQDLFDEGHNVINFLTQIALHMGCDPIIFVGMDLADAQPREVIKNDIHGKPIYTQWKWIQEAHWTASLAKENPDTQWFNATEGGLGFKGIENKTLKEITHLHLQKRWPLEQKIVSILEEAQMPSSVNFENIASQLDQLSHSLKRSIEYLKIMKSDSEMMLREEQASLEGLSGTGMLAYHDLTEEMAYPVILEVYEKIQKLMASEDFFKKQPQIWDFVLRAAQTILICIEQS